MAPCPACVAATQKAGILTRCRNHPLKDGGLQFTPKNMVLNDKGRLQEVSLGKPDPKRLISPPFEDSDWPARPTPHRAARIPFEDLSPRPVSMTPKPRGWHKLVSKKLYPEPRWWADRKRGWD